ncbi:hypothetical protein IIY67_01975 [Candidatus Saccharibacteria bacterium]|nr:hypothetical protein [Candidatus Saccharibacteria bacterium]
MQKNKDFLKKTLPVFLFALLALGVIGGTVAWLTAIDHKTNSFSVGDFTIPTTKPSDSSQTITPTLTGNLYEENWDENATHKLLPGKTFAKDPRVGLGTNSEEAVVYICVENANTNKVYFTIANDWSPVANYTTAGSANGTYTKGLFKYNSNLGPTTNADAWTSALFSNVVVADDAESTDFVEPYDVTVNSYIHQAKNGATPIPAADIEAAAKAAFSADCPQNS